MRKTLNFIVKKNTKTELENVFPFEYSYLLANQIFVKIVSCLLYCNLNPLTALDVYIRPKP